MHSCTSSYLLVSLDNLDDLIVNLPPEQLLGFTAIVNRVEKHQFHTKLPQPENIQEEQHIHVRMSIGGSWATSLTRQKLEHTATPALTYRSVYKRAGAGRQFINE